MQEGTLNIIKATLDGDNTLSKEEKAVIWESLRKPKETPVQSLPVTFVTPNEVVRRFGISLRTIQRWISTGQLPSRRLGGCRRIPTDALEAFIQGSPVATVSHRQDILQKAS